MVLRFPDKVLTMCAFFAAASFFLRFFYDQCMRDPVSFFSFVAVSKKSDR